MDMNIGGNIRRLRLAKGLTQEQLAEVFGVSAQAVSRWENDSAYPDITLLPGMAMYFGVSTDELIGMDSIRKEERLFGIHGEINRLVIAGDAEGAVRLIRESLRLFPGDSGLLMSLGETLAHLDDEASVHEAIRVEERLLADSDAGMKARCTITVNLIFLYMKAGMQEKAVQTVKSLPHIWEAREMIMPEVYTGEAYHRELKTAVRKALVYLCMRIGNAQRRDVSKIPEYVQLGVDFDSDKSVPELLEIIDRFMT